MHNIYSFDPISPMTSRNLQLKYVRVIGRQVEKLQQQPTPSRNLNKYFRFLLCEKLVNGSLPLYLRTIKLRNFISVVGHKLLVLSLCLC